MTAAGIRIPDRVGYTVVPNGILPDGGRISARAWGLYVYLLSRPPGWVVRVPHLQRVFREGRDAIYSALDNLREVGLAEIEWYRDPDVGMPRQRWVLIVPAPAPTPNTANPDAGNPSTEKPDALVTTEVNHRAYGTGSPQAIATDADDALDAIDATLTTRDGYGLDDAETRTARGMLEGGEHPKAIVNTIRKRHRGIA